MKIVIGSHYHAFREELAFKIRKDLIDVNMRDDLRGSCYFCKTDICGKGVLLVDSYSAKGQFIMVPAHIRCYSSAEKGEFDRFS